MLTHTERIQQEMLTVRKKREELVHAFEEHERAYHNRLKELDTSIMELQEAIRKEDDMEALCPGEEWNVEHEGIVRPAKEVRRYYEREAIFENVHE